MNRLLVTGIGRSGTQYMARLLSASGMPCGHEALYPTDCRAAPDWGPVRAESAWPAAAWLPSQDPSLRVVHLVRHPLQWLASWSQTVWGPGGSRRATKYLTRHTGIPWRSLAVTDALSASMRLWVAWNRMIEPHAHVRLRVEDVDALALRSLWHLGGRKPPSDERIEEALKEVPTNANARPHGVVFAQDCLGKVGQIELAEMALLYGYAIDWRAAPLSGGAGI